MARWRNNQQRLPSELAALIIAEDGLITVAASEHNQIERALEWIRSLTEEPEVGRYTGKVVYQKDFGAFVNIMPGTDGMVHISKLATSESKRLNVLTMGQRGQGKTHRHRRKRPA